MKVKLQEILDTIKTYYGTITSDEELTKLIVQEVIYKESDLLAVGTKVVAVRNFSDLYVEWAYPGTLEAEYPVPEGSTGGLAEPITWTKFNLELKKAVVRFEITDEAKLRMLGNYQLEFSRRRAAEALALAKDKEILGALLSGAHKTINANATWDDPSGDPAGDIVEAIGWIFSNSEIPPDQGFTVIVPAKVWASLMKLQEINNIVQSVKDYVEKAYKVKFYPSRGSVLTTDALVLVPGEMTAIHGVLRTNKIPLTETKRDSVRGTTQYIIRQYFATKVIPNSNRIVKISGVASS